MNSEQLDALSKPKSIAVIGASDKVSSWSLLVWRAVGTTAVPKDKKRT
jgi:hypothetical protein